MVLGPSGGDGGDDGGNSLLHVRQASKRQQQQRQVLAAQHPNGDDKKSRAGHVHDLSTSVSSPPDHSLLQPQAPVLPPKSKITVKISSASHFQFPGGPGGARGRGKKRLNSVERMSSGTCLCECVLLSSAPHYLYSKSAAIVLIIIQFFTIAAREALQELRGGQALGAAASSSPTGNACASSTLSTTSSDKGDEVEIDVEGDEGGHSTAMVADRGSSDEEDKDKTSQSSDGSNKAAPVAPPEPLCPVAVTEALIDATLAPNRGPRKHHASSSHASSKKFVKPVPLVVSVPKVGAWVRL